MTPAPRPGDTAAAPEPGAAPRSGGAGAGAVARRKRLELGRKLASLEGEFGAWRAASERDAPMAKHHSQIRRITAQLGGAAAVIAEELSALGADADVLARARTLELDMLAVHRLWEFFRAKLAQRYVPWLADFLAAADEVAHRCYAAAGEAARAAGHVGSDALREPPLVFLNGGSSPYAQPRHSAYEGEAVPGEGLPALVGALRALPVPVIGLPWVQLTHLPDLLLIAHEVGHHVEDDLGMAPALDAAVAGAVGDATRRDGWRRWRGELFADLYGVLSHGPAYAASLVSFLVDDPHQVAAESQRAGEWGDYPTTALRVQAAAAGVELVAGAGAGDAVLAQWRAAFGATPPGHPMQAFEADVAPVVAALATRPLAELGGRSVLATCAVAAVDLPRVESEARLLRRGHAPERLTDPRLLLAAGSLAIEQEDADGAPPRGAGAGGASPADPTREIQRRVLAEILRLRTTGVRAGGVAPPGAEAADRARGRALLDGLRTRPRLQERGTD